MKLSDKGNKGEFTPHPESDGMIKAVLVDITPLKAVQTQYGEKEKFRLVYETEMTDGAGKRYCIWSQGYTPSLNEKASFRKDLKKIMGRPLTDAELGEFDTEALLGTPVQMIVQHQTWESDPSKTSAVISFIGPDKSGDPLKPSGSYKRVKDREPRDGQSGGDQAGYRKAPSAGEDEGRQDWQKVKVHVGKHAGVDLGDLDEEAVKALLEKWLPTHKANAKPKADDKRLAAALDEVAELLGLNEPASAASDF